jgi:hypothetical protein
MRLTALSRLAAPFTAGIELMAPTAMVLTV